MSLNGVFHSMIESSQLQAVWRNAKQWRHVPLGPIRLTFKFGRAHGPRAWYTRRIDHRQSGFIGPVHLTAPSKLPIETGCAVVVGVGPGLGEALALLLAQNGCPVALVSRSATSLAELSLHLRSINPAVKAYPCDVTDERAVVKLMNQIEAELGIPQLVICAPQHFVRGSLLTMEGSAFEECWRGNCLGPFLVARESARRMAPLGRGTILFAGATSGTIGRSGYLGLAVGKFGLRALSQVVARELHPKGIHVCHVVIDGDISETDQPDGETHIKASELAELFLHLHKQPRSCWTSELDARPAEEAFWEHC